MIVADTNLLAGLFFAGADASPARWVLERDREWSAPPLWRSEFRSVLLKYIRHGDLARADAVLMLRDVELVIGARERDVSTPLVLELAERSGCSSYDCEYVALALELGVPLVTSDRHVLAAFPEAATTPEAFVIA